ncbi:MAG: hypothetical protein B6D35_09015 [Candidatus Brocadia sp. UTAMX2]|nr:MAG: hypothetical protein B6D35_09015 [Candidatus Brocadia sp. UTAMX2]
MQGLHIYAISQSNVVITTLRDIMLKPYECEKQNPKHEIYESTQSGVLNHDGVNFIHNILLKMSKIP